MSLLAKTRIALIGAVTGLAAMSTAALAEPSVTMDVDTARVVKVSGEPATVVLSNPMYADATIQANRLILIGKQTGRTQVIVLDLDGNQLANFMVNVQRAEEQVVSMYRAGRQVTLHCAPFCDRVLTVNDDVELFQAQSTQIQTKTGISAGGAAPQGGGAQ
jgi:Flp pilus assembly secretin CpaC